MSNDNKKNIGCMNRIAKIGEGSYGIVYSGNFKDDKTGKLYAIKRNFKELSASWFGNIHEADVLVRLRGHPFIVDLHKISLGDPFDTERPMSPVTSSDKKKMMEDKLHFILEHASVCGDDYIHSKNFSYANSKIILTQILLALDYMHSKKIIHRDLKPANILMDFNNNVPYAKICDFGMSCNFINYEPKTPGVVTSWYRAPEICFGHTDYDYKSDVWSFGCLLFEFMSKEPWIAGTADDDTKIVNAILAKLEDQALDQDIEYLQSKATKKIKVVTRDNMKRRLKYESQLNMRPSDKMNYEKYCGNIEHLVDLLKRCLQINPQKRASIDEILNHEFFSYYRNYINSVRTTYSNLPQKNQIVINKSLERKWVVKSALQLYNSRKENSWYSHNILFHAINLFERFMDWASQENNDRIELHSEETTNRGKLYNKQETELRFWVCLYVMHKYYSTLIHPKSWERFCPEQYRAEENSNFQAEDFEYRLIKYACSYKIFQETLYEIADKYENLNEEKVFKILTFYSTIDNYIGGLEGLYQRYRESSGNPITL